ncbi:MAG: J domain-containing protein [Sulfuricellaceae bacterium]|nr:J domain-containing protein [Sulfuricellaceae bacterium]
MNITANIPGATCGTSEIEALREQLVSVLETIEHLLEHDKPHLLARYQVSLGDLEFELFNLQVESLTLRRRIELMQAFVNRGEPLTAERIARIETEVTHELHDWRERLLEQERVLQDSRSLLENVAFLNPEDSRRLKTAYRRLARLLHPDAALENAELFKKYWLTVQQAYGNGDLALLDAVLTLVEGAVSGAKTDADLSGENRQAEMARLRQLVTTHIERLARLRQEPPFCIADLLDDEDWVSWTQEKRYCLM